MPKRKPLIALGIDPGLASIGVAILERSGGVDKVLHLKMIQTERATKKKLRDLRVADDDQRRVKEVWDTVDNLISVYDPSCIGIESFTPNRGQKGGSSWKVVLVMQAMVALGWSYGYRPMLFRPEDLKRKFLGKQSGTKEDVENALREIVSDLDVHLNEHAKGKHEHLTDAIGHAVLALNEMEEMRRMAGIFRG